MALPLVLLAAALLARDAAPSPSSRYAHDVAAHTPQ